MRGLNDKVALVTGGAEGLGAAAAERLAAEGADVVISDVQVERGEAAAAEHGFAFIEHDVRDPEAWTRVVERIEAEHGRLDVLVNNAGIVGSVTAVSPEQTTLADWRATFAVNVEGVLLGCQAAIPAMRRVGGGSIVNLSSVAGLLATPYATAYGASKATVRQLTKTVAQHCAEQRIAIRCNSVHPGNVLTPLWERQAAEQAELRGISAEEVIAEAAALVPLGGFTDKEDVAAAIAFLASEDARHVTGAALVVDGGLINCDSFGFFDPTTETAKEQIA
jgi:3(or 17)beta-hydroxysteroid dehydrogenase